MRVAQPAQLTEQRASRRRLPALPSRPPILFTSALPQRPSSSRLRPMQDSGMLPRQRKATTQPLKSLSQDAAKAVLPAHILEKVEHIASNQVRQKIWFTRLSTRSGHPTYAACRLSPGLISTVPDIRKEELTLPSTLVCLRHRPAGISTLKVPLSTTGILLRLSRLQHRCGGTGSKRTLTVNEI